MSSPPSAAHAASPARQFATILLATAFTIGGYFAISGATKALGYGDDAQPLRVVVVCVFLLVNGFLVFAPGMRGALRVTSCVVGVALAVAAWVFLPIDGNRLSLAVAVGERDGLRARIPTVDLNDPNEFRDLKSRADELARRFPSLAGDVRAELDSRAREATEAVRDQIRHLSPTDVAGARATEAAMLRLGKLLNWGAPRLPEFQAWLDAAVQARRGELQELAATDWAGFDRTAAGRHELANTFPETRTALIAAEGRWTERSANFAAVAFTHAGFTPTQIRTECRKTLKRLLALQTLDDSPQALLDARGVLFATAHDAAKAEIAAHHRAERYGPAFTVVLSHDLEWLPTTQLLGSDTRKSIDELRESCRYLAVLSEKAGSQTEAAPPPRTRP